MVFDCQATLPSTQGVMVVWIGAAWVAHQKEITRARRSAGRRAEHE